MKALIARNITFTTSKSRQSGMQVTNATYIKVVDMLQETKNTKIHTLLLMMLLDTGYRCNTLLLIRMYIRTQFPDLGIIVMPYYQSMKISGSFETYLPNQMKSIWTGMRTSSNDKIILRESVELMYPENYKELFKFMY